ncbi:hypothetical protein C8F04DRAFT_38109 [Mycena alexandri]|uniref:Uncharacterized protein n=1 Tax=Mycena alexandri TaxID=1745969 RepID=A0AAD6TFJ3_9AGAR|nr:hypothetical protein C8F04DRAFT_38109 [Mycena alexandri]
MGAVVRRASLNHTVTSRRINMSQTFGIPHKLIKAHADAFWARFTGERVRLSRWPAHIMRWPALVILGQLCLQGLGWGFLAVIKYQGPLALTDSSAFWVANNSHLVTLLATLISTFMAGCSSFFFSYALRRSMSLYLLRPTSLAALGASVNISMRSLVVHLRNWKWPAVSLLCFIMAGIQTSVWSTLITPVKVTISTPLVGREIDLASPILQQLISNDPHTLDVCQTAESGSEVYGGVLESGYASGQSYLGLPAAVSLLGKGFNVSTRGILTASLNDTVLGSWFVPATAQSLEPRPKGISDHYSMIQQGFSADVSCSLETLTEDTSLAVWAMSSPGMRMLLSNPISHTGLHPPIAQRQITE